MDNPLYLNILLTCIQAFEGPVYVFASDPWYPPMPGAIKNLEISCDNCEKNTLRSQRCALENGEMAMEIKTGEFLSSLREGRIKKKCDIVDISDKWTPENITIMNHDAFFRMQNRGEHCLRSKWHCGPWNQSISSWNQLSQESGILRWPLRFNRGLFFLDLEHQGKSLLDQKFKIWERSKCRSGVWQQKMWSRQDPASLPQW